MALNENQIRLRIRSLSENLKQAMNILEDLDLNESPSKSLSTIGNFAAQAAKDAYGLAGVMEEKAEVMPKRDKLKIEFDLNSPTATKYLEDVQKLVKNIVAELYPGKNFNMDVSYRYAGKLGDTSATERVVLGVGIDVPSVSAAVLATYPPYYSLNVMEAELRTRLSK